MTRAWLSLSGHPLEGETLARFVYLDESGISNPRHEPVVVVAGVIVDADKQLTALERAIEKLADRMIPASHREGFFFHAKDLFGGKGPIFSHRANLFTFEQRLSIADELAAIPRRLRLPVVFGAVNREAWPISFDGSNMTTKERLDGAHLSAFMVCSIDVEQWMRTNAPTEATILIVENNDEMKKRMKETLNQYRKPPEQLNLSDDEKKYFPFKKIKASPHFEMKQDSAALQIADFCAYVLKRRAMSDPHINRFFSVLQPLLTVHGAKLGP